MPNRKRRNPRNVIGRDKSTVIIIWSHILSRRTVDREFCRCSEIYIFVNYIKGKEGGIYASLLKTSFSPKGRSAHPTTDLNALIAQLHPSTHHGAIVVVKLYIIIIFIHAWQSSRDRGLIVTRTETRIGSYIRAYDICVRIAADEHTIIIIIIVRQSRGVSLCVHSARESDSFVLSSAQPRRETRHVVCTPRSAADRDVSEYSNENLSRSDNIGYRISDWYYQCVIRAVRVDYSNIYREQDAYGCRFAWLRHVWSSTEDGTASAHNGRIINVADGHDCGITNVTERLCYCVRLRDSPRDRRHRFPQHITLA